MIKYLLALALAAGALPTLAQTTPRGERAQAKADRKMERAHSIKHGRSISKEPKLVREEKKMDDRQLRKHNL